MTLDNIINKLCPITPVDRGCKFRLKAKEQQREEGKQMIEQYVKQFAPQYGLNSGINFTKATVTSKNGETYITFNDPA